MALGTSGPQMYLRARQLKEQPHLHQQRHYYLFDVIEMVIHVILVN